jgi:heptosyltransferase-2
VVLDAPEVENPTISTVAETDLMEKILVLAPNWIGDAVLSLPVIDGVGRLWPGSEITVLARTGVAQIFSARKSTVEVVEYQKGAGVRRIAQLREAGWRLRRKRFQLALLLPNSLSSAIMAWLAGVPKRVGYATDGRGWLLTNKLKSRRKERGLHQVDYYIHLIHSLGANKVDRIPRLELQPQIIKRGSSLISDLGLGEDELLVGVHPGSAYGEAKRWFPERFAVVLDQLNRLGCRIVLFGGPGEEPLSEQIREQMSSPPLSLVGRTTVAEALALISKCSLFLSNDSGLMHVAAALRIPQVALFGSTDPQKTAPLNDRAVVIHPQEVNCTPCFKPECPEALECMMAITVDEVFTAAEGLLHIIEKPINIPKGQQKT